MTKEYAFKDGREVPSEGILASFSTNVRYGTLPRHENLLSVQVSTDFNGNYMIDQVLAATWRDITSDFKLAPESHEGTTEGQSVPSGKANISPGVPAGTTVYFAYRYKKTPNNVGGHQRNWFTYRTLLENKTPVSHLAADPLANKLADGKSFTLVYDHNFDTSPALYRCA